VKKKILIIGANSFIAKNYVNFSKFKKRAFSISTKDLIDSKGKFNFKKIKKIFKNNSIKTIINFTSNNNNSSSESINDSKIILDNINFHLEILELIKNKKILIIYFDSFEKFKNKNSSYKVSKKILESVYKFYQKKYKLNVKKILLPTIIGVNDLNFNRLVPYILKQILNNKKVIIKKQKKIIFTFVENVVSKIDNIISNSKKKFLMKKYNKKVNYIYSEFKKIHQNKQYKNNKLFKIYAWYKSYFEK
jgi:hypothetical protein